MCFSGAKILHFLQVCKQMDKFSGSAGGLGKPAAGTLRGRGIDRIEDLWILEDLDRLGTLDDLETLDRLEELWKRGEIGRGDRGIERAQYLKVGIGITTNVGLWGWREWCNFALFFERWFIELYGVLYLRRIGNATETKDHSSRKARQSAKIGVRKYRYSAEPIN